MNFLFIICIVINSNSDKSSYFWNFTNTIWNNLVKNIFKIAVEIEYSQKFGRILDETLSAIIQSLVAGEFHYYYFFVRSNVIKTNYIDAMKGGRHIHSYIKNDQNRWVTDTNKLEVIPDWLLDKVFFMQEENLLGDLTSIMQACEQFAVEEVNQ